MNSRTIGSGSYTDTSTTTPSSSKSTSMSSTAATSSSTTTTSSSAGASLPSGQAQQRQSDQGYQALRRRRRAEQQRQRESKANSRMANSAPQPPSSSLSQSLPPSPPKPQPQEVVQSQIPLQQPTSSTSTPQRNQSSTTPLSKSYKTTTTIKRLDKFGFVINEEKINDVIFDARSNSATPNSNSSSSPHGPHLGPPPSTPPRPTSTPSTKNNSKKSKKQKQTKSQKKLTKKALHQKRLEQHKIQKWQAMMADWSTYTRSPSQEKGLAKKKLRQRARRGVPDHIRGDAWILLGGVRDRVKKDKVYQHLIETSSKTLLHSYSSVEEMEGDEYSGCSSVMDTIERDINRTFPRHYLFMRDDESSSSSEISSSSSESESESTFLSEEDGDNSILEEEESEKRKEEEEEIMEENASVEVGDDGVPTWIESSTTATPLVKRENTKDEHDNEKLKENDVENEENGHDQNDCNKDDDTPKTPTQAEITKNKDTSQPKSNESSNSNSQTSTSTSEPTPAERFHSVMERVKMIEERSKSSKAKKGQHSRNNSLDSFVSKSSYASRSSTVKSPVRSSIAKFERGTVSKVEKKKKEEEELLVGFGEKEKEEEEEYNELLVGFGGSKNNTTRSSAVATATAKSGEEKEEICAIPEEALVGDDEDGSKSRGGIPTWVESRSMSKDDLHKEGLGMVGSGGNGGMEEIETGLMAPSTTEPKDDEEKHSKQKNAQRNNSSRTKKDSDLLTGFRGERNSSIIPPSSPPPPKKSNHDTSISTSSTTTTNKLSKEQKKRLKKEQNYAVAKGGQASLRRVLRAYSIYDKEVGYCQGMNFIAAMFITFMEEEEAFWMLVYVMNDPPCRMRGLFGEAMTESHQVLYIAEKLISQFLPKLSSHLNKEGVHITMFATQWLLTLYTSSFPFDLVTRVWDCFLAEGWKIIYRVMLAILDMSSKDLLGMGFEGMLGYFRNLPSRVDGEKVLEVALKVPLKRKHIEKYKKEFRKANNHQS